tara:strand:- start:265 stop:609 length:345 start_codon:yes stop_codon:yes gene_type:complete
VRNKMIEYTKGKKAEGDLIVRVNGHQLTFKELAEICVQLCKNEDKIYPFPYKGGAYLTNFLVDCMDAREVSDAILNKYHLNETPKNDSNKNLQLKKSNFDSDNKEQQDSVEKKS